MFASSLLDRSRLPLATPSFPTRRSSDLFRQKPLRPRVPADLEDNLGLRQAAPMISGPRRRRTGEPRRSEEHTSELQSPVHLVCRLLLEKKNTSTVLRV